MNPSPQTQSGRDGLPLRGSALERLLQRSPTVVFRRLCPRVLPCVRLGADRIDVAIGKRISVKLSIVRPLQLTTAAFVLLLVAAFVLLAVLASRNDDRINRTERNLADITEARAACRALERSLLERQPVDSNALETSSTALRGLQRHDGFADPESARLITEALERLDRPSPASAAAVAEALDRCQAAVDREDTVLARQMHRLRADTDRELSLALAAPIVLLALVGTILLFARARIQEPLRSLSVLVSRLSEGELTPVPLRPLDPLVLPLFKNYNRLVERLRELEAAHRRHEVSLTREVQTATRALLEQHRSLSRADRLAATGELAASMAHELRNPLASIQVTLGNLQRETDDPDVGERLNLVIDEVTRLSRLVDGLLSAARHTPELPRRLVLADTVEQLLTLTRYQLPLGIELRNRIPKDLAWMLPEDGLRQALLNLILNAAAAMPDNRGVVTVEARATNEELAIVVWDDGPGLPPHALRGAVRPFDTTRAHGTGLGLAMVQRFTRELGGSLRLANREPHGAEITMLLPGDVDHV